MLYKFLRQNVTPKVKKMRSRGDKSGQHVSPEAEKLTSRGDKSGQRVTPKTEKLTSRGDSLTPSLCEIF